VLGEQQFDLLDAEHKKAFVVALAQAIPQSTPPAGEDGLLLSLVEGM
jgi:hypothetical protein